MSNRRPRRNDPDPAPDREEPGPTARERRLESELRATRANQVRVPGVGPVGSTGLLLGAGLAAAAVFLSGDGDGGIMAGSSGSSSVPTPNPGESYQEFTSRCLSGGDHDMAEAAEAWNAAKS